MLTFYSGTGTTGPNLGGTRLAGAGAYTVVASFAGSADYAAVQSVPVTFTITAGTRASYISTIRTRGSGRVPFSQWGTLVRVLVEVWSLAADH